MGVVLFIQEGKRDGALARDAVDAGGADAVLLHKGRDDVSDRVVADLGDHPEFDGGGRFPIGSGMTPFA